jgi:hypothetical protein
MTTTYWPERLESEQHRTRDEHPPMPQDVPSPPSNNPPNASVWAFTTHDRPAGEKPRLRWMLGSATFTIVASTTRIS